MSYSNLLISCWGSYGLELLVFLGNSSRGSKYSSDSSSNDLIETGPSSSEYELKSSLSFMYSSENLYFYGF